MEVKCPMGARNRCPLARSAEPGIPLSLLRRRHGEEAVSPPAGIGVLADDSAAGINAHRNGADGIEGRCARNVNRDGVRTIWELEKPMSLARVVNISSHEFLARTDVPNSRRDAIGNIKGL